MREMKPHHQDTLRFPKALTQHRKEIDETRFAQFTFGDATRYLT
jgi:hypothetical protein